MSRARLTAGLTGLAVTAALLAGCGDGGISLPTSLPTELPSVSLPGGGEETDTSEPSETTPEETSEPSESSPEETTPEETTPEETTPEETTPEETAEPEETTPEETAEPEETTDEETTAEAEGDDESGTPTWWIWLLAGAVLVTVVLLAVLPGRRRRRRWDEETAALRSDLDRLDAEIVPDVLTRPSRAEAGMAWQASGAWRFELDRRLRAQLASAPDPVRQTHADGVQRALAGLVAAVDAELATPAEAGADQLRSRRAAIEQARVQLRAAVQPPPL